MALAVSAGSYVGRLAPSPTGLLHLGHARTFWIAAHRAREAGGRLLLRNDDLDSARFRGEFVQAFEEDLRWLGLTWEGAMVSQSERLPLYRAALERLRSSGAVFPCRCTRGDVLAAVRAPHEGAEADEPIYPGTCRKWKRESPEIDGVNWRFRVPDGEEISFEDGRLGEQRAVAGRDFGDFVVWRKDGVPSYQLACAVDDADLGITEVVRGDDLVKSTFRQLLILRALGARAPSYYHCPMMTDSSGRRLAKREDALSIRAMREQGAKPEEVVARYCQLPGAGP